MPRAEANRSSAGGCWIEETSPSLLFPAAHVDADRRADQAERFPQAVDQEAFVGEMKLGGDVGEEDERRRRDPGLRCVENAHFPPARARRWMDRRHGGDEPIQL